MKRLIVSHKVLDTLGFSEYHDLNGDCGTRTLTFSDGTPLKIWCYDELGLDNPDWHDSTYIGEHSSFSENGHYYEILLLQDLLDCVQGVFPAYVSEFVALCKSKEMLPYLSVA